MEIFVKTIRLGFGRTLPPCPCGIWQGEEPCFQLVGVQMTLSSPQILAVFKKKKKFPSKREWKNTFQVKSYEKYCSEGVKTVGSGGRQPELWSGITLGKFLNLIYACFLICKLEWGEWHHTKWHIGKHWGSVPPLKQPLSWKKQPLSNILECWNLTRHLGQAGECLMKGETADLCWGSRCEPATLPQSLAPVQLEGQRPTPLEKLAGTVGKAVGPCPPQIWVHAPVGLAFPDGLAHACLDFSFSWDTVTSSSGINWKI